MVSSGSGSHFRIYHPGHQQVLASHDAGGRNCLVLAQHRLDLFQLATVAADLDLVIEAPE